ncbi:hypothetical protein WR25_16684 [Diploscapter pachys]|uniref:Uncharacterized protein n=1 Tax=Diploscapter pachys TaxID=2018661 RepID=A0A2A2LUI7_9BILA|nr:hypothetical protein WR25_16684 [Diploscapter pachys]
MNKAKAGLIGLPPRVSQKEGKRGACRETARRINRYLARTAPLIRLCLCLSLACSIRPFLQYSHPVIGRVLAASFHAQLATSWNKKTPSMGDERRSPSEINGEIDEKAMLKTKNGRKNGKRHLNGSINGSAKKIKKEEDKDSESGKDERDEETPSATATPLKDNRSESPKETLVKEESTNGNENGLSVSTSTPAAVMVNGHAKEEPMDTHAQQESTSNGIVTCEEKESDDDNEFVPEDPNDDGTWQAGDEVGYTTTNKELKFTLATVRKCGQLSARTDLCFRWKKGWSIEMQAKKRQEEERNRLQQQANSQQPQGLNLPIDKPLHPMPIITTPTQIKKPEFPNGLPPNVMELMARGSIPSAIAQQIAAGINPPVSVFGAAPGVNQIDPNVLMMLHHHHQQQQQQQQQMQAAFHAHLMHQAAQQSQMQQIEQQQRLEMQRQLIMAQQAERERQVQAAQAAERERQQREQAERERQQREAEARAQAQAQAQAIAASQQAQRLMMNPPFSVADQQSRLPVGMAPPGSAPNSSAPQQGGNPPAGMAQPPFAGMHPEQLRIMEFMQAQHQMNALMQSCPPEMQQLMMAQLSGGGAAAANNPLIHSMLQAQQQQAVQQQLAAAAAAGGVNPAALMAMMMPPNSQANVNSDMMRRLQQEGFQNAALRH